MGSNKIPPRRASGDGGYRLRVRAVLFEGEKARRPAGQRVNMAHLEPEQLAPDLTAYIAEHAGFAPRTRRGAPSDSAPRRRRLEQQLRSGPLALLTWNMPKLDGLTLKTDELAHAARKSVQGMLKVYAPRAEAYEVAVQRGALGGTHAHIVLPLEAFSRKVQAAIRAAPSGKGGGVEIVPGRLHAVLIDDGAEDLERVAAYLSRDPDGRFDLPEDHPAYLQAHAEELSRKKAGRRSPRLSWTGKRS